MDKSEPDHRKDKGLPAAENSTVVQSDSFIRKKGYGAGPAGIDLCPAIGGCSLPSLPERNEEALPISFSSPHRGLNSTQKDLYLQYVITGDHQQLEMPAIAGFTSFPSRPGWGRENKESLPSIKDVVTVASLADKKEETFFDATFRSFTPARIRLLEQPPTY